MDLEESIGLFEVNILRKLSKLKTSYFSILPIVVDKQISPASYVRALIEQINCIVIKIVKRTKITF